jgi:hypothetical protein
VRPQVKSCPAWSIGSRKDRTTGRKIRTNPHGYARRTCADSNQQNRHNAFFLPLVPSPAIFNREGIV